MDMQNVLEQTTKTKILEEIKNILIQDKCKDSDCVSLYDITQLLKKLDYDYESCIKRYEDEFHYIIRNEIDNNSSIVIYNLDYKSNELCVGFTDFCELGSHYDHICFNKKNGDLYVSKSESCYTYQVFKSLCSGLSSLYDELMEFKDYKDWKNEKLGISPINSKFKVNIKCDDVEINMFSKKSFGDIDFSLSYHSDNKKYSCKCNSGAVQETILGKENEIFKRIFVKIDDCPKWSQDMLYEIRQKQLLEERKQERKLQIKRKIFPFLKK